MVIAGVFAIIMGFVAMITWDRNSERRRERARRVGFTWLANLSPRGMKLYGRIGGMAFILFGLALIVVDIASGGR